MRILYLQPAGKGLYYDEFLNCLASNTRVHVYGPGHPGYNFDHKISDVMAACPFRPQLVVVGAGWENDDSDDNFDPHPKINLLSLERFKIPKVIILNKEYKKMQQKASFISSNNIDLVFTVHHHYYT